MAAETDKDVLLAELRQQLEAVKARLTAHREEMEAAGLTSSASADPESPV